jgi:hypothetical protein
VAADIHRSGLKEEPSMQYYVPVGQERGFSGSWLIIRPRGEVTTAWPALREALQAADPEVRSIDVRQLSQGLAGEVRPFRLGMVAFGLSATLALIVAGLGLYSIMAHAVAWRRHEIGVRLALGARPRSIARLVVGRGALLATAGIGLGWRLPWRRVPGSSRSCSTRRRGIRWCCLGWRWCSRPLRWRPGGSPRAARWR